MNEIWKQIKEAPDCEVSNFGNVRIKQRTIITSNGIVKHLKEKEIAKNQKRNGYLEVALPVEKGVRIYRLVHRLVLTTFNPVDNMDEMEVNHKDENKKNNILSNLEWVTSKENCNYGTRNERTKEQLSIKIKCVETGIIYNSFADAQAKTGIDKSSINMCCTGYRNRKTAGGYHWCYA